jgi:hypothetical protein
MRRFSAVLVVALIAGVPGVSTFAQKPAPAAVRNRFPLTIDSIMRGPELVGWPPTALRWSLYFDWRKPGEKEPSTYLVSRDGGDPRKLTDDEAKNAPPANGRWDKAHGRLLSTDGGDVVIHDGKAGKRIYVTRTTGSESSARWARNDTHVTYPRSTN